MCISLSVCITAVDNNVVSVGLNNIIIFFEVESEILIKKKLHGKDENHKATKKHIGMIHVLLRTLLDELKSLKHV